MAAEPLRAPTTESDALDYPGCNFGHVLLSGIGLLIDPNETDHLPIVLVARQKGGTVTPCHLS